MLLCVDHWDPGRRDDSLGEGVAGTVRRPLGCVARPIVRDPDCVPWRACAGDSVAASGRHSQSTVAADLSLRRAFAALGWGPHRARLCSPWHCRHGGLGVSCPSKADRPHAAAAATRRCRLEFHACPSAALLGRTTRCRRLRCVPPSTPSCTTRPPADACMPPPLARPPARTQQPGRTSACVARGKNANESSLFRHILHGDEHRLRHALATTRGRHGQARAG